MSDFLETVVLKAMAAALASLVLSVGISYFVVPLMGGQLDGAGLIMTLVLPVVIALPASAWQFWQYERLKQLKMNLGTTLAQLDQTNERLVEANRDLRLERSNDPTSRLLTRHSFEDALAMEADGADIGHLMRLKIDRFAIFRQVCGEAAAEMAIFAVATAIRRSIHRGHFAGRLAEDEFAIYMPASTPILGSLMVNSITSTLALALFVGSEGPAMGLTLSAGSVECAPGFRVSAALDACARELDGAIAMGGNCSRTGTIKALPGLDIA